MRKQFSIFFLVSMALLACNNNNTKTEMTNQVTQRSIEDSLVQLWNDAWNKNDTVAIGAMFDASSVMMSGSLVIKGTDSIMSKWVNGQVKRIANLKTEKTGGATSEKMAYYNGFWTLDVTNEKDSVTGKASGNFTALWQKQDSGKWTMSLIHMGNAE